MPLQVKTENTPITVVDRRTFVCGTLATLAGSMLSCRRDTFTASPPPPGAMRSHLALAQSPYFELTKDGLLHNVVDDAQDIIDCHAHLGLSYFLSPELSWQEPSEPTRYLVSCDWQKDRPCGFTLDDYQTAMLDEKSIGTFQRELLRTGLPFGSPTAKTHTLPNLLAEMDALGIARTTLLPIALRMPWSSNPSAAYLRAAGDSRYPSRFIIFGSVHPDSSDAVRDLEDLASLGIRGFKLHPLVQRFYADSDNVMPLYEACERLGLPVLFHAGRAGIEPSFTQKYGLVSYLERAIRTHPNVSFILGHAGSYLDGPEALVLAQKYPNVYLELSGQGRAFLKEILHTFDVSRLLYGTDWPFYPQALTLSKILELTEQDRTVRRMVLSDNARRLFKLG